MSDPSGVAVAASPTYSVRVDADKVGARLDRFLADALPGYSRRSIKDLIAAGRVSAGLSADAVTDADHRVRSGETFFIRVPPPPPTSLQPLDLPLNVVHGDDAVLVIDKPAGLIVHPGAGTGDRTLVHALLALSPDRLSAVGAPLRPGIVHRLDKDTSGLIVVARTDEAHHQLVRQFAGHTIERAYLAIVWGCPSPPATLIEGNIGRSPVDRKRMAIVERGGKPARTRYRVLEAFAGGAAALVECRPETGRTHQIRVHMASIGHPLIGDAVYGGRRRKAESAPAAAVLAAFPRQALHAHILGFAHPTTAQRLVFTSPMPSDMQELVANLKSF